MSKSELLRIVELIYASAEDPENWSEFLRLLRRSIQFDVAAMHAYDYEGRTPSVGIDLDLDASARRAYESYYGRLNPWIRGRSFVAGRVLSSDQILPLSRYRRTEFGQDFGVPNRIEYSLSCNLSTCASAVDQLSLNRRASLGLFTVEEHRIMRALVPHLQRAIRLSRQLSTLESFQDTFLESAAVFVVDANRRILEVNAEAERMLKTGLLFSASNGSLGTREPNQNPLNRLAAGLADTERMIDSAAQEYRAKGVKISRKRSIFGHAGCTVLIVRQSGGAQAHALSRQLGARFSLTQAEMRLVEVIPTSRTLKEAAATIGVSPNTAKTHLTRILRKTGMSNQRQLVQLISQFRGL
jgi:DNA-binding CsgD family transcriptional regulator